MSNTYKLLREAEASFQDNSRHPSGYERLEICLNELNLSYNQILSQNFDALMHSYFQINTVITNPYNSLKLPKDSHASLNAGLSDFLAKRRLQIIERIDKILKRKAFDKINELAFQIEDKNLQSKITQLIKQLEFLVYNKRSDWLDRLNLEQIMGESGANHNVPSPPAHSNFKKEDSAQRENIPVRSFIDRLFHRSKKE
jgi:hypothetical protein